PARLAEDHRDGRPLGAKAVRGGDRGAGAGGGPDTVGLGARAGTLLSDPGLVLRRWTVGGGPGPWPDRWPGGRGPVGLPGCGFGGGRRDGDRPRAGAVSRLAACGRGGWRSDRGPDARGLCDLPTISWRSRGIAGRMGDLRVVRRRRRVRVRGRD